VHIIFLSFKEEKLLKYSQLYDKAQYLQSSQQLKGEISQKKTAEISYDKDNS
jgi:hypothetical protein